MMNEPTQRTTANAAFSRLQGKAAMPTNVQTEIAAQASARDENMMRLRQLRLERDALVVQAEPAPVKTRKIAKKSVRVVRA